MFQPFSATLRSIVREPLRGSVLLWLAGLALFLGWLAFALLGRLTLVATSVAARVEARLAPHAVETPIDGQVDRTAVHLGQHVDAGQVLVEIDVQDRRLQIAELDAQVAALTLEITALDAVITQSEASLGIEAELELAERAEATAREQQATARTRLAGLNLERQRQLGAGALISEADVQRAEAELEQARAAEREAGEALGRIAITSKRATADRATAIAERRRELAQLVGRRDALRSTLARLDREVALGQVCSPIAGRIGSQAQLRRGSYVKAGDPLLTVIPDDDGFTLIAHFAAADSIGRVQPGQSARLRLDAYPWAEFGSVRAVVEQVGGEITAQGIRVELGQLTSDSAAVRLCHGLTGTVEIEIERCAPVTLLLRKIGALADRAASTKR